MRSKIALFFRIKNERKILLAYGLYLAIYSHFIFLYNKKKARFGNENSTLFREKEFTITHVIDVRFVIKILIKYIPWEFMCRHQAWVAGFLLKKYQIPFTVYVGFKKNSLGIIEGHAWTIAYDIMVSGFCDPTEYVIQAKYCG